MPDTLVSGSNLTRTGNGSEPIPLYIGTLQPTSIHWWSSYGRFYVDFLRWVFEDINSRKDILPGYELRLVWKDTQGEAGLAARQMFELLSQGPPLLALCGVGLSDELVMVGNVAQHYNLPLLSYSAHTSNSLSRDGFQSVYITNYQGEAANKPFLAILEHFGWSRVSTIIFKDVMFETQMEQFHSLLSSRNMTLATSAVISDLGQAGDSIQRLKQFGARIIVGAFRSTQAPYIFCETANEYTQRLAAFSASSIHTQSRSAPYAYDAAWALALTLNRTQSKLSEGALNDTRLEDFDYSREDMFKLNLRSIEEIAFQGVSVSLSSLHDQ
ncbi:hypothetical protein EGW08_019694 [Elysia chlorotica]|uniref:Receptor ligand binding region domain-containing protein n=1 Tax=Elysia chlorotica TaxID=188477 RepID=A0A3S1BQP0_ELYCH|nr:hypothetical protein EGW08_019694 [Elysia chlorotica]